VALEHAKKSFFTQAKSITATAVSLQFSLRETVDFVRDQFTSPFVGSAETVAAEITRWFEGRAFDGINVHAGHPSHFRRFTQEVVPLLQQRGLFRSDYEHPTLRGNLRLPRLTYYTRQN
jgi:alkanesulfonate monooxygenase SsuD/methylene tetrahydromethanopterin reductase-like flavin-dependent oxidoreductase (luciferase family)